MAKEVAKPEVDVAVLLPGGSFHQFFVNAWARTLLELVRNNKTFYWKDAYSSILPDLRNRLVGGQPNSEQVSNTPFYFEDYKPKKVFFIDSDIVWQTDDFLKLLNSDEDIIAGWYSRVDGLTVALKKVGSSTQFETLAAQSIMDSKDLIEVDGIGLGFMCVKYEVLEKIGYPWFKFTLPEKTELENGLHVPMSGEDVWFCQRAQEEGFTVKIDPQVQVEHMKTVSLFRGKNG